MQEEKVTIICLKYGKKYKPCYVNKLYNMVSRHLTVPYDFICITEDTNEIMPNIRTLPLETKEGIKGWWYKPFVFSHELDIKTETVLFLDLDIVIYDSIDKLFSYKPDEPFIAIKGFTSKNRNGINSSCFRFRRSEAFHLYESYINNYEDIISHYEGDQDWLGNEIKPCYWPKEWIHSFKHGLMGWPSHLPIRKGQHSWRYITSEEPKVPSNSCIAVFHGRPNPHEIKNKWCIKNWS